MKTVSIWALTMLLLTTSLVVIGDDRPPICFKSSSGDTTICV